MRIEIFKYQINLSKKSMSKEKSAWGFIFLVLLTFVFFLLIVPVIFGLHSTFLKAELIITAILLILAVIFIFGFERPWKAMFFFYIACLINTFAIYTRTWLLSPLVLPIILIIVGLYASAINLKEEDDFEYDESEKESEPHYEEPKITEAAKKTTKKKKKK